LSSHLLPEKLVNRLTPQRRRWLILALVGLYWGAIYLIFAAVFLVAFFQIGSGQPENWAKAAILILAGGAILWIGMPMPGSTAITGAYLPPAQQPTLHQVVTQVASGLKEPVPGKIVLVLDADLYVTESSLFSPWLTQRNLIIGLLLMQTLGPQHIQALIAAELSALSYSQDRVRAWIYRHWRWVMFESRHQRLLWQRLTLFRWYGRLLASLVAPLIRAHQLEADQRAASWAGSNILATALRSRSGTMAAYRAFLEHEFLPVVNAGFKPPILEGFARFLNSEMVQGAVQQVIFSESNRNQPALFEPVPPLGWRLQGIQGIAEKMDDDASGSALRFLTNVQVLESDLLRQMFKPKVVKEWKPIDWEQTGVKVFLPIWQRTLKNYAATLNGVLAEDLAEFLFSPDRLWVEVKRMSPIPLTKQELRESVLRVTAIALTIALVRNGWQVEVPLGQAISLRRGEEMVRPFELLTNLAAGKIDSFSWRRFTRQAGIASCDLGRLI